jgi:hypothetical protein
MFRRLGAVTAVSRTQRWRSSSPAALLVALSVSCGGATAARSGPAVSAAPTAAQEAQDRQTISGRFSVITGDPPPDSGQKPQRRYILTESSSRRWTLTFDDSVFTPPGGILSFNGKDVEVSGRVTGTDRLLVESMRLR